jgi:hypothetical protein
MLRSSIEALRLAEEAWDEFNSKGNFTDPLYELIYLAAYYRAWQESREEEAQAINAQRTEAEVL